MLGPSQKPQSDERPWPIMVWTHNELEIDTNLDRVDFDTVFGFLRTSYWASHRTRDRIVASWRNAAIVFGMYQPDGRMVGGCRVVTDTAVFAWLADVFVIPECRGKGFGKTLIQCVLEHPVCRDVEQFLLGTKDAHGLYSQFGWRPNEHPDRFMLRRRDTD